MIQKMFLSLSVVWMIIVNASNHDALVPQVIKDGFKKYRMKDINAALDTWHHPGFPSQDDSLTMDTFLSAQKVYGKYQEFEVVDYVELSSRNALVYIIVNYERGPLFSLFTLYFPDNKWVVSRITVSLDAQEIFPDFIWTRGK